MNHEIGKPEALDIRVSKSSLVRFVTEECGIFCSSSQHSSRSGSFMKVVGLYAKMTLEF